jgi:hypothetical protein
MRPPAEQPIGRPFDLESAGLPNLATNFDVGGQDYPWMSLCFLQGILWRGKLRVCKSTDRNENEMRCRAQHSINRRTTLWAEVSGDSAATVGHPSKLYLPALDLRDLITREARLNTECTSSSPLASEAMAD